MISNYNKQVGDYYDIDSNDFDKRYWNNFILQRIRQDFRENTKKLDFNNALEIGCGTGIDLLHFSKIFPGKSFSGIDISSKMVEISRSKIEQARVLNCDIKQGSPDEISKLYPNKKFDLIFVYFGALNTVENFKKASDNIIDCCEDGGFLVLSFVNKHYLAEVLINLFKLKFCDAFRRYKKVWGGYSPNKHLNSKCLSARMIRETFLPANIEIFRKGYSILYPAWYRNHWLSRLGLFGNKLWKIDSILNKSFFWQFGEYTFFIFKKKLSKNNL
mgnify:FL=1|tara:strand:- start:520 stop:1338 length:819 start_codon:yes stop_codon:yes gene_type:complete